ncbi:MAG: hypothetical protein ACLS8R_03035 [Anaeromassilibacillus sp.]
MRSGDCSCVGAQGVWRGSLHQYTDWYVKQINNSIVAEEQADSFKTKVLELFPRASSAPESSSEPESLMTFSIGTCRVTVGFLFVAMLAFFLLLDTDGMVWPGIAAAALHECGHLAVLLRLANLPRPSG